MLMPKPLLQIFMLMTIQAMFCKEICIYNQNVAEQRIRVVERMPMKCMPLSDAIISNVVGDPCESNISASVARRHDAGIFANANHEPSTLP